MKYDDGNTMGVRGWRAGAVAAAVLLAASGLQAAPAPWYWWVSKLNGDRVCAQSMPVQGWQRAEGPFQRADCSQPMRQGLLVR